MVEQYSLELLSSGWWPYEGLPPWILFCDIRRSQTGKLSSRIVDSHIRLFLGNIPLNKEYSMETHELIYCFSHFYLRAADPRVEYSSIIMDIARRWWVMQLLISDNIV